MKPTHPRLVKIFSYIINFVRFRESQTPTIDSHFNKLESTKSRIEVLFLDNQDLQGRLDNLRANHSSLQSQVKAKNARTDDLKGKLFALKKDQERLQAEMDRTRSQKTILADSLAEKVDRTTNLRHEADKLRPYASQSITALQAELGDLADALSRDRGQIEATEKRSRALQTSSDTFTLAANDITPLLTSLGAVASDLGAEETEAQDAARRRDALTERSNNVREVERTEALLQRQLSRWLERTEGLRLQAAERGEKARESMLGLKGVHGELVMERKDRGHEVERRRVRIEQTEKKVSFPCWIGGELCYGGLC